MNREFPFPGIPVLRPGECSEDYYGPLASSQKIMVIKDLKPDVKRWTEWKVMIATTPPRHHSKSH